jgi:Putative prokaryotic signal transducing protein
MVMLRPEEWVVVRNCGFTHEADVIVAVLEAEGIETFVPDSHMASIRPELSGGLGGIRVLVRESDLELACEALAVEEAEELPGRGMLMGDADVW